MRLEWLEQRLALSTLPQMPAGNYFRVNIANETNANGGGKSTDSLWISVIDQETAYDFTEYQDSGTTVWVAAPTSAQSVPSKKLSELLPSPSSKTASFFVNGFVPGSGQVTANGGRIYLADQENAVPWAGSKPGTPSANAAFNFDWAEFALASGQLNFDTTQVDQMGIPMHAQVSPVIVDMPIGTGITKDQSRSAILGAFQDYVRTNGFVGYEGVVIEESGYARLLAPQHLMGHGLPGTSQLNTAFDQALYELFNYYTPTADGGEGHTLFLVGNGGSGPEVFQGNVRKDFSVKDVDGNTATYTVFQFQGLGVTYIGNQLDPVTYGGATYQIFYPYFAETSLNIQGAGSTVNSFNSALDSAAKPPAWYSSDTSIFPAAQSLALSTAGRMTFAASNCFADDVAQQTYYASALPPKFDHKMLGNLGNQMATLLNRGITPVASVGGGESNLMSRTGYFSAQDLIYTDPATATAGTTSKLSAQSTSAAVTFTRGQLITAAGGNGQTDSLVLGSLSGKLLHQGTVAQSFAVLYDAASGQYYVDAAAPTGSPTNHIQPTADAPAGQKDVYSGSVILGAGPDPAGQFSKIQLNFKNGPISSDYQVVFEFDYGATDSEPHHAVLHLVDSYTGAITDAGGTNDLGPASGPLAGGLRLGMNLTSVQIKNPTYIQALSSPTGSNDIVIRSVQPLQGINSNIIMFSDFYNPGGQWNRYAGFFHKGAPSLGIEPPLVDGLGYAYAYDDNGGDSSDLSVTQPSAVAFEPSLPFTTLSLTLLPWVGVPWVESRSADVLQTAQSFVIRGTGFDPSNPANNTVLLRSTGGAVTAGTVTAVNATGTQLTYRFTAAPPQGDLLAVVTTAAGTSAESQVATVVNQKPQVNVAPASFTTSVDTPLPLSFTGTPFADLDAPATQVFRVIMRVADGDFSATSASGVTVGRTPKNAIMFTGRIADLNAFFTTNPGLITYTPKTGVHMTRTTKITLMETGTKQATTSQAFLNMSGPLDVQLVPTSFVTTTTAATRLVFSGAPFVDPAASPTGTFTVIVRLPEKYGTISATSGSGVTVGSDGESPLFTGTLANLNAFFTATSGLITYTPEANAQPSRRQARLTLLSATSGLSATTSFVIDVTAT